MREVSCRVLDVVFQQLKKQGLPPETLSEGVGVSLAHLRNKHERIDWAEHNRVMENVRRVWADEEIVRIGGSWIESPFVRHTRLIFGAVLTPRDFYKWIADAGKDGGKQVFTCMQTTVHEVGPDEVLLDVVLAEGYEPCPTFFLLTLGGFRAVPKLTGNEEARVETTELPRGVQYRVHLPRGSGRQTKLRRAFHWLKSPLAAANELDDAHAALQQRYEELELARQDLEKRVVERTAELQETTLKLAGTVRDLEEAKEVRDRIFANVNHDLRSPLSLVLLTVSEIRAHGDLSFETERSIAAIEHGARRVLRMVDELLILAEGREGAVRLWMANIDLGAMVSAVGNAWMPAAHAAGLVLEHQVSENVSVRADANALERILANLVSNAIKFTPREGTITISLVEDEDHAVLRVADTGPGIDAELKTRLFGRFERGARSASTSGSGLGLSLVKELAEAHGGSVSVADADGPSGTVFEVRLPRASERGSLAPRAMIFEVAPVLRPEDYGIVTTTDAQTVQTYEPAAGITPRATLLLAEDDPDLRERTAKLLADTYRVIAAPNGAVALEIAMKQAPDLLITDIAMPEMDGIELTRRFRALPSNRLSPVLVLTTFGAARDKLEGFDAGAVDYIQKPFEPMELRARIRSQLTIRSLALQLLETEKLAALGTLSAGLAHEIRNPANGIINAVAPLREVLPPEVLEPGSPAAQLLDIIEQCSKQVAAMSRQLLGFKRNVEPKRQDVPLDRLIARVCTTTRPSLKGVELREALDYKGPIHCAEPLLAQVITNLVQNGAHAAGRGGWVEVRTGLDDQKVIVEVRDSGPGVPDELRERIFEPFFTTKPAGSGTGLGLSTARDIVLRHGGTLDVRRAAGAEDGSTRSVFRIEIPLIS